MATYKGVRSILTAELHPLVWHVIVRNLVGHPFLLRGQRWSGGLQQPLLLRIAAAWATPAENSHSLHADPSCWVCLEPDALHPPRATPPHLELEILVHHHPSLGKPWPPCLRTDTHHEACAHTLSWHTLAPPKMHPHGHWTRYLLQLHRCIHGTRHLLQPHVHPHTHQTQPACLLETASLHTPRTGIPMHLPTWIQTWSPHSPHPADVLVPTHERRSFPT